MIIYKDLINFDVACASKNPPPYYDVSLIAAQNTINHLNYKTPLVLLCMESTALTGCLQIINTALNFASWCIYFSTYPLVLYIMYTDNDAIIIMLSTTAD